MKTLQDLIKEKAENLIMSHLEKELESNIKKLLPSEIAEVFRASGNTSITLAEFLANTRHHYYIRDKFYKVIIEKELPKYEEYVSKKLFETILTQVQWT